MVNAAVCVLHLEHPLELETSFVENIGNLVSALRDTGAVAEESGSSLISVEKVSDSLSTRNYISAVVAGIVPAAADVDLICGAVNCCERLVAGFVTKVLVLDLNAAAL